MHIDACRIHLHLSTSRSEIDKSSLPERDAIIYLLYLANVRAQFEIRRSFIWRISQKREDNFTIQVNNSNSAEKCNRKLFCSCLEIISLAREIIEVGGKKPNSWNYPERTCTVVMEGSKLSENWNVIWNCKQMLQWFSWRSSSVFLSLDVRNLKIYCQTSWSQRVAVTCVFKVVNIPVVFWANFVEINSRGEGRGGIKEKPVRIRRWINQIISRKWAIYFSHYVSCYTGIISV